MKIVSDVSLWDFEAWSGGRDTLVQLQNNLSGDEMEALENAIVEALDPEGEGISDTTLNDFLWFEPDTVAELAGYKDWEDFMRSGDKDEEEEEDGEDEEDE